jgi:hypothetical protein
VPGPGDAPVDHYLREAYNVEVVFPLLRGLHGTMAFAPGHVLFAGFGGEVSDDPDAARDETTRLSYPRWEPEYRLKLVHELAEHQLVVLLATPPAHKGHGTTGSEALAELVGSHRPRVVVCGGERRSETLGRSLVVSPGPLDDGHYAGRRPAQRRGGVCGARHRGGVRSWVRSPPAHPPACRAGGPRRT